MPTRRALTQGRTATVAPPPPRRPKPLKAILEPMAVPMPAAGLSPIPCPVCETALTIHQPDSQAPGQLLGVCDACGTWAVITPVPEGEDEALILHLPIAALIQQALDDHSAGKTGSRRRARAGR